MSNDAGSLESQVQAYLSSIGGRSANTVDAYRRDLLAFAEFCAGRDVGTAADVDTHCVRTWVSVTPKRASKTSVE